jgi:aminodeoxyfutalosine synthase
LKAWTPVEIAWFVQVTGLSIRDVLRELVAAGLGSLPGGGAEIFHPDVRRRIAPLKADAATWLQVHRTAHEMGLRSNATMLYGHLETPAHRVDHLLRLRELQDETGGFQAFIPLAFHPDGTQLGGTQLSGTHLGDPQLGGTQLGGRPATAPLSRSGRGAGGEGALRSEQEDVVGRSPRPLVTRRPTALEDLRVMAVSRLFLDNFDHVKAYWISLGVGTAQVALCYGADDLDGTVRHESIHHEAGSEGPESLSVDELCALIREAGRTPIERDSLYRPIRREGTHWEVIA